MKTLAERNETMDAYAENTGINCPVCNKEFVVGDIIDTAFVARAKSQADLLAACEAARDVLFNHLEGCAKTKPVEYVNETIKPKPRF